MTQKMPINLTVLLDNLVQPNALNIKQAQRIFHGRGHAYDNLSHITIDWLNPLLLITLFKPVDEAILIQLSEQLTNRFPITTSIQLQHRYNKSWIVECIWGEPIHQLTINENELKFKLEFISGKNTGLFLDMKNGRDWVKNYSKDKCVLNLFSYTCGFSIAAASGGAQSIYNIDMSSPFLNTGRDNHHLNEHSLKNIRFDKLNILKSFGRIKRHGPYDIIICDPPTFQKGSIDLARDYSKMIKRFVEFLSKDGALFLCINTPHIGDLTGKDFLLKTMEENTSSFELQEEIKPPSAYKETQGKGTKVFIFNKIS